LEWWLCKSRCWALLPLTHQKTPKLWDDVRRAIHKSCWSYVRGVKWQSKCVPQSFDGQPQESMNQRPKQHRLKVLMRAYTEGRNNRYEIQLLGWCTTSRPGKGECCLEGLMRVYTAGRNDRCLIVGATWNISALGKDGLRPWQGPGLEQSGSLVEILLVKL
jgi:hypothetical protein